MKSQQIITVVLGGSLPGQTFLQNSNQTFSRFKISINVFLDFIFAASEFPGFSWKQKYQDSLRSYSLFIIQVLMLTQHIPPSSDANLAYYPIYPIKRTTKQQPYSSMQHPSLEQPSINTLRQSIDSTNSGSSLFLTIPQHSTPFHEG